MEQPTLQTSRLILRPYAQSDLDAIVHISNNMNVVRWTSSHPFPYQAKDAQDFLVRIERETAEGKSIAFAAVLKETGELVGGVGIKLELPQERGEIGYMLGEAHWGRGYATEAVVRLLRYGFEDLGLSRINASVHATNAGSIRVLEKVGMVKEGLQRRHVLRFGVRDDLALYGMLRGEWHPARVTPAARP